MELHEEQQLTHDDLMEMIVESSAPRETYVDTDGYIVDADTGEIVGHDEPREAFVVDSVEKAEWVLEQRSAREAAIAAIDARLKAVTEQLLAQRKAVVRRLAYEDYLYSPSLIQFARSQLSGKSRTVQFGWGKVSFRSSTGTNTIVSMDEAVAWMRRFDPSKVKVRESVNVTDVLKLKDPGMRLGWLKSSGPKETVVVSTGIDVKVELTEFQPKLERE